MNGPYPLLVAALLWAGVPVHSAAAQPAARISVQQITPPAAGQRTRRTAVDPVRVAPVRSVRSPASGQEVAGQATAPAASPEAIEVCRRAQAEDRPAPSGVDCITALRASPEAVATAEGSLLELFGQPRGLGSGPDVSTGRSTDADAVARQLSTGDVQGIAANGTAGIVGRDRAAPPPTGPR